MVTQADNYYRDYALRATRYWQHQVAKACLGTDTDTRLCLEDLSRDLESMEGSLGAWDFRDFEDTIDAARMACRGDFSYRIK